MKESNILLKTAFLAALILSIFAVGCSFFKAETPPNSAGNTAQTRPADSPATETNPASTTNANVEKPDLTVTAEELDKEFTDKDATTEKLEKYASKNIQVTGRVSMLVTEKSGKIQPYVTLFAPGGVLHGVSCYFDDENVAQMKILAKDKMATVQGFRDKYILPKIPPRLSHCVVIKGS